MVGTWGGSAEEAGATEADGDWVVIWRDTPLHVAPTPEAAMVRHRESSPEKRQAHAAWGFAARVVDRRDRWLALSTDGQVASCFQALHTPAVDLTLWARTIDVAGSTSEPPPCARDWPESTFGDIGTLGEGWRIPANTTVTVEGGLDGRTRADWTLPRPRVVRHVGSLRCFHWSWRQGPSTDQDRWSVDLPLCVPADAITLTPPGFIPH